jgi:serine/threonine protein kinase
MILIPGYTFRDCIYDGTKILVYRGLRNEDNQPVVIKLLKSEFSNLIETTRLK